MGRHYWARMEKKIKTEVHRNNTVVGKVEEGGGRKKRRVQVEKKNTIQ
jgi:hypothetical protein